VSVIPEGLPEALEVLRAGRWAEAADVFARLRATTDDPRAHEGAAQAAWWLDDADVALDAREAAYRAYRRLGDDPGAARAAAALGYDSILFGRGVAVGRGWLARAAEVLGQRTDLPEAGWVAAREAEVALNVDHDALAAHAAAGTALRIARASGEGDLGIVARALTGLAEVRLGQVDAGMKQLGAAATAATAGDVEELMWTGKICCWLISACQETHDVERAGEWCARVEQLAVRRELAPLFAVCRTQYASIQLARGEPRQAESTLVDVLGRLERSRRLSRLDAVAQLGELRRRQGRLKEAESLLRQAGYQPAALVSRAHAQLDAGDPARAWSLVSELLRSIPVDQPLDRVDALTVAVTAGVAAGHGDEAAAAARELREIADRVGTDAFRGHALAAEARLAQPPDRRALWQDAARLLHRAGLVFDEADCRLELAESLLVGGEQGAAEEQAELALETLRPLGSGRGVDRARAVLAPAGSGPLTDRQIDVLRLLAGGLSNGEIASRLQLSEHTVHRHIANIYRALDVGSRAAAASYATRHGLI
jgi:ATP/maltotriose-dependent transcriptional regulator MalT